MTLFNKLFGCLLNDSISIRLKLLLEAIEHHVKFEVIHPKGSATGDLKLGKMLNCCLLSPFLGRFQFYLNFMPQVCDLILQSVVESMELAL